MSEPAAGGGEKAQEAQEHRYTMSVDLSVVESLGINLYSNAAAVLSELVANAYDADANVVSIDWKPEKGQVIVTDDGLGMNVPEINERFLTVGYKKRLKEGSESTKFNRPFMGRKGIGKLSVFSIAETVCVYSTKGGKSNGLKIIVADLLKAIEQRLPYHPEPIDVPAEYAKQGTTLVLADLKTKRVDLTVAALRKRLARRFDVLDTRKPEEGGFKIKVNGKDITWADRQELKNLQFIWEFGKETLPKSALPNGITRFVLPKDTVNGQPGWKVSGWIGTAHQPTDLTEDPEAGSLKNVIVLARKRPIQEGIIEKLDFSRIFGNYVTGQVEADFLDVDDPQYDDIATSDRQRLIEDDPRVIGLQKLLRDAFKAASETWSSERPKKDAKSALDTYPKLKEWVEQRPGWQQDSARRMIASIASLPMEKKREVEDRAALFRAGVLAFERIGLREVTEDLDNLSTVTADRLLELLGRQDVYETALWGDILRSRVEAISRFRNLTRNDDKEKVLQEHLFNNLWMLDPSWERATLSERMEENLRHVAPGVFAKDPEDKEITGRLDIHYVTNVGTHVIVEMKRYSVHDDASKYALQGRKYYNAMKSICDQQQEENARIEIIFVLGSKPRATERGALTEDQYIEKEFSTCNGRYVLYDRLIRSAELQYEQYLDASDKVTTLNDLLESLTPSKDDGDGEADGDDQAASNGAAPAAPEPSTTGAGSSTSS
jgi:hypothetical protein